jgi:hypothetical protein
MSAMSAVIEKETGAKVVITLREIGLPTIEEFSGGVSMGEGTYTHEGVARALLGSLDYEAIRTPILPRNAIYYSEGPQRRNVILEIPPHKRTAYYHKAVIKNVSFPRLLFGFELTMRKEELVITDVKVAALEDSSMISEDSQVYFYPYTNVQNTFSVCWNGQIMPSVKRVSQLGTIPELFFNSPNSDCYYASANLSKLSYRELVTKIKGKQFPDEYLKPTGYTLQQWISQMSNSTI